jgi:hypothetical protein
LIVTATAVVAMGLVVLYRYAINLTPIISNDIGGPGFLGFMSALLAWIATSGGRKSKIWSQNIEQLLSEIASLDGKIAQLSFELRNIKRKRLDALADSCKWRGETETWWQWRKRYAVWCMGLFQYEPIQYLGMSIIVLVFFIGGAMLIWTLLVFVFDWVLTVFTTELW